MLKAVEETVSREHIEGAGAKALLTKHVNSLRDGLGEVRAGVQLLPRNWRTVVLGALILSAKMWDDTCVCWNVESR